jgi:hypothetical protein
MMPASAPMKTPNPPQAAPSNRSVSVYRRIAATFLALTAGIMALVFYIVFARAEVVVMSEQQEVSADFIVDVARKPADEEVKGDVFELTESLTQSFPAASLVQVDTHAEGTVRITSSLFRNQTLIATTRLLTPDGVLFRIKKTVVVPANGSVEVEAFADAAGPTGDVGTATFTIPGLNPDTRRFFKVETVGPMLGAKKDVRMVTKQDVDSAAEVLLEKLTGTLTESLRTKAKDAGAPTDGELLAIEKTSQVTDVAVGAEAQEFSLTVTVRGTGVFYEHAAFEERVRQRLLDRVSEERELQRVDEASRTLIVEKKDLVAGRANVGVTAKGTSVLSAKSPSLDASKLTNITTESAKQYLERLDGVSSASVRARPFWTGRMPNVASHIKIEVR